MTRRASGALAEPVNRFRIPVTVADAVEACHRALRNENWQELASDTYQVEVDIDRADQYGILGLLGLIPPIGKFLNGLRHFTVRAPAAPPTGGREVDAELFAVSRGLMFRISLQDAGAFGTDLLVTAGRSRPSVMRSRVGELRRAIEIQAGSVHPFRVRE